MGYTTNFEGFISIEPPIGPDQVKELNKFCGERHEDRDEFPGIWCDLYFESDGTRFGWNGSEKTYALDEWVQYIIDNFFDQWGVVANGELRAQGESSGDVWKLLVENNRVSRVKAKLVWENA